MNLKAQLLTYFDYIYIDGQLKADHTASTPII